MTKHAKGNSIEVQCSKDFCSFSFTLHKADQFHHMLQFSKTGAAGFYHLGLGVREIDDFSHSLENETKQGLLATSNVLAAIVHAWLSRFPKRKVLILGIGPTRRRFLRMFVNLHFALLNECFELQCLSRDQNGRLNLVVFSPAIEIEAFVVGLKVPADKLPPVILT